MTEIPGQTEKNVERELIRHVNENSTKETVEHALGFRIIYTGGLGGYQCQHLEFVPGVGPRVRAVQPANEREFRMFVTLRVLWEGYDGIRP